MHKLCHIPSDCGFWDTERTAWEEDSDESLDFPLWPFSTHPFCLQSPRKWSHSFHYPWNHLLNSSFFSLTGEVCIIYRSTQTHPNAWETGTIHIPEAQPGNLFLSQEKGGNFCTNQSFEDLVILGSVMVECCSTQSRSSTKTPKVHLPALGVRNLVLQALNQPFPAPPSTAGAQQAHTDISLSHCFPKLHGGYSNSCCQSMGSPWPLLSKILLCKKIPNKPTNESWWHKTDHWNIQYQWREKNPASPKV